METASYPNIVTNYDKGSRKGLTEGVREFIKIDNERALSVGYLNQGMETFKVRKPKVLEGFPEVTVGESPDELTLKVQDIHQCQHVRVKVKCAQTCGTRQD